MRNLNEWLWLLAPGELSNNLAGSCINLSAVVFALIDPIMLKW